VTGVGLEHLRKLTNLESLSLFGTRISDSSLEHLRGPAGLKILNLRETGVSDAGLEHLRGLTKLERLDLTDTRIAGPGLSYLANLAGIRSLTLANSQITDAGLEHLRELTQLESLSLRDTKITGRGLKHVSALRNIRFLGLGGTQVDDTGLAHLKGLSNLERLSLRDARATDIGMSHLKGLANLRSLSVQGTQATEAGLSRLKDVLPDVNVDVLIEASRQRSTIFRDAEVAYRQESYEDAIAKYEEFLRENRDEQLERKAIVRLWMSQIKRLFVYSKYQHATSERLLKNFPNGPEPFRRPKDDPLCVLVVVDEYNNYRVETVDWEAPASSVQALSRKLFIARDGDSTGNAPVRLLVEAHPKALARQVIFALDFGVLARMEDFQLDIVTDER
jgi:hypothetical protein